MPRKKSAGLKRPRRLRAWRWDFRIMDNSRREVSRWVRTEAAFGSTELPRLSADEIPKTRAQALAALQEEFKDCQMCALARTRTKLVFGSGNPEAELMFVGEAPGFDEDREGLPFVGAAG